MNHFPLLFSKLKIGSMSIQNRIVMPAMHLSYSSDGYINDKIIEFYKARAKSEIGLIIIGGCYVNNYGMGVPSMISISDDKYIDGLRKFASVIHETSSVKVAAQLYHSGRYSFESLIGTQPVSASATYSSFSRQTSRALTIDEIHQQVEDFARAAERAKKAGFDAVEICGSAGYLIDQFMSPLTNKRTDKYGGSVENRLRFPIEVIEACKNAIGENMALIMRYSGSDLVPGSNKLEDKVKFAPMLESAGLDALNVTGGWHESRVPSITMNVPPATFTYFSNEIRKAVNIPVFASNRINDPALAESILRESKADAVCIGRGQICDPEFAAKARNGDLASIRKCIGCNQGCFDAVFTMRPVTCLRNPAAGNEAKYKLKKADNPLKIMVVGAGIAGLEFARVAAERGHHVTIHEKSNRIGGQAWLASTPPGRNSISIMMKWYEHELKKLKVPIVLEENVTGKMVLDKAPDIVILATGAKPVAPNIKGVDLPMVHFAWDFLKPDNDIQPGLKCAVIGGGATGVETALALAQFGVFSLEIADFLNYHGVLDAKKAWQITRFNREVYLFELFAKLGTNFGKSTRWIMLQELEKHGIKATVNARVKEISSQENGKASIVYEVSEQQFTIKDIDSIYLATQVVPNDELEKEIKGKVKYYKVGDAKKTKDLLEAISTSFKRAIKV
ncbi:MAG: oxidoreductase [Promethearchaeota archaeon]